MSSYKIEPKRSAIVKARLQGETPSFTVDVPDNDNELTAIVGTDDAGVPKLTFAGLAREFIANRIQAEASKRFKDGLTVAGKDDKGNDVYNVDYLTDEQIAAIVADVTPKAYKLLIGERAEAAARVGKVAKLEAELAAKNEQQTAMFRTMWYMVTDAGNRAILVQTMTAGGFAALATELQNS